MLTSENTERCYICQTQYYVFPVYDDENPPRENVCHRCNNIIDSLLRDFEEQDAIKETDNEEALS